MSQFLEIDSLDTLIKAVQDYRVNLDTNRRILTNAANVCDQAMGSDAVAQRCIQKLYQALEELERTSRLAEQVAEDLKEDRQAAYRVLDEV